MDWKVVPTNVELFEPTAHTRVYASRDESGPLSFPFLHQLASTPAVQRLRNIGFLGAIEFLQYGNGLEPHRHRHNRFDHSVGVANLAYEFAKTRELDSKTTKTLVAAALLHDVGHGPLSHTLEPIFSEKYGLTHHRVGDALIRGALPLGRATLEVLSEHRVDRDEIIALLNGETDSEYSFLFSSPMNLDTFEGITRSRYFATSWSVSPPAALIVASLARKEFDTAVLDAFWELKDAVYRVLVHSRTGVVMDAVAQAYMRRRIDDFHASDFYRDERQLRRKHPGLFAILGSARSIYGFVSALPAKLLDQAIEVKARRFFVDKSISVGGSSAFEQRYRQTKSGRCTTLADLLPPALNSEMRVRRDTQLELMGNAMAGPGKRKRAV